MRAFAHVPEVCESLLVFVKQRRFDSTAVSTIIDEMIVVADSYQVG
jgi:hypothetical protein